MCVRVRNVFHLCVVRMLGALCVRDVCGVSRYLCVRCGLCVRVARAMCSLRGTYVISLAPSVFGVSYVWHGIVVHVLCDLIGFRSFCPLF